MEKKRILSAWWKLLRFFAEQKSDFVNYTNDYICRSTGLSPAQLEYAIKTLFAMRLLNYDANNGYETTRAKYFINWIKQLKKELFPAETLKGIILSAFKQWHKELENYNLDIFLFYPTSFTLMNYNKFPKFTEVFRGVLQSYLEEIRNGGQKKKSPAMGRGR